MAHRAASDLDALMRDYAAAWAENDAARLKTFWDESRAPVYLAEEIDAAFTDWAAVEAYWRDNEGRHLDVRLTFSQSRYVDVADGLVMGVHQMDWFIAFTDKPAMGGDNRVAALYRETGEGWRLAAWIEAPLAAITYIRKLYELRA